MPVHGRQLHSIQYAAADPEIGIRMYSDFGCQLIRPLKAYSVNILRQAVGVFLQDSINLQAVCIVNFNGQRIGNTEFLQVDHRLPHPLLFLQQSGDFHRLSLTYPLDLGKAFRFFFHNPEGILSEFPDDPGRKRRAHSFYRTGTEVSLNARFILRSHMLVAFHLKLVSVNRMGHISACQLQVFPFIQGAEGSHAGDFLSL